MCEADRVLLKEKTASHEEYRMHSGGDGDCSWMGRMRKSGIEAFNLLEAGPGPRFGMFFEKPLSNIII